MAEAKAKREAAASPASAGAAQGLELPGKETVLQLAWLSNTEVVALCSSGEDFTLRRINVAAAELSVISVPKSFSKLRLKLGAGDQISLSPGGGWLCAIETLSPTEPSRLRLWRLEGSELKDFPVRTPPNFSAGLLSWDEAHSELFLSAAPYMFPEQIYSVASVNLVSGAITGAVLRGNVDLIHGMASLPEAGALLLTASSFQGDFPLEQVAVLCDLASGQVQLLNSRAEGLQPLRLADGTAVLLADRRQAGKNAVSWTLPRDSDELLAISLQPDMLPQSLASSPSGTWLGFMKIPEGPADAAGQGSLVLQRVSDGYASAVPGSCSAFAFAPDSTRVCAAVDGGRRLVLVELQAD